MNVSLAVLADYASVTKDGKLCIMGIFSRIMAISFPMVHPSFCVVLQLEGDSYEANHTYPVAIDLIDADGKRLFKLDGSLAFGAAEPGEPIHAPLLLAVNQLRFEHEGDYTFKILINHEPRRDIRLKVVKAPTPAMPPAS